MVSDSIGDLLTRIRNAQMVGHSSTIVPQSKLVRSVLDVLKGEGYVGGFDAREVEVNSKGRKKDVFVVQLKYYSDGTPGIRSARRFSKPGRRMYAQKDAIHRVESGLGISIVSTSQGVMSDREARKRGIGGEVLALIS
jgi:small subunit ribosomal protein S8